MEEKWDLKKIVGFFYLLIDVNDCSGKDILQKRFKKDLVAMAQLYLLIKRIDELGYKEGISYAFNTSHFDTIKGSAHNLIEIRKFCGLWRVLTYHDSKQKKFVMLDAFKAHRHLGTLEAAQRVESKAEIARKLLRGVDKQ